MMAETKARSCPGGSGSVAKSPPASVTRGRTPAAPRPTRAISTTGGRANSVAVLPGVRGEEGERVRPRGPAHVEKPARPPRPDGGHDHVGLRRRDDVHRADERREELRAGRAGTPRDDFPRELRPVVPEVRGMKNHRED